MAPPVNPKLAAALGDGGDDEDVKPQKDTGLEIEIDDDEDDEDEGGQETRVSRDEKKKARGRGFAAERDAARDEAVAERTRREMLEREVQELRRERQAAPPPPRQEEKDDTEARLEQVRQRQQQHAKAAANDMTPEEEAQWRKELYRLREEETEIIHDRVARKRGLRSEQFDPNALAAKLRTELKMEQITSAYPELMANPNGAQYAGKLYSLKMARAGLNEREAYDSPQAWRFRQEAVAEAARELGTDNTRNASAGQRAKYAAASSSGRGSGPQRNVWRPTAVDVKMADTLYKNIKDPKERLKTYYTTRIKPKLNAK